MNDLKLAFCGIDCTYCPAYKATISGNLDEKTKVAKEWSEAFKTKIKPEDINCEGCLSRGERVFSHCNVCEIRKCGIEKNVPNCAHCDEYVCEKLDNFLKIVPGNRNLLEQIMKTVE